MFQNEVVSRKCCCTLGHFYPIFQTQWKWPRMPTRWPNSVSYAHIGGRVGGGGLLLVGVALKPFGKLWPHFKPENSFFYTLSISDQIKLVKLISCFRRSQSNKTIRTPFQSNATELHWIVRMNSVNFGNWIIYSNSGTNGQGMFDYKRYKWVKPYTSLPKLSHQLTRIDTRISAHQSKF